VIISTGAGVAVPFIYVGRLLGIRTIYLESWTRVKGLSLSARLVYPVVDVMLVQWPEVAGKYAKAMFKGQVL
jgi:UDP-N-acetylglucosamine:LPS N-acetylglucosamine transferase